MAALTAVRVQRTYWDGAGLHIDGMAEDAPVRLPLDDAFCWTVSDPRPTPAPDPCVFEPRIIADPSHACDLCHAPTDVYIAFYGSLPKVGLTLHGRLDERLREQGADAGMRVAELPDRGQARLTEQSLSTLMRIPEWRRGRDVLARLAKDLDADRIEEAAMDVAHRLPAGYTAQRLRFIHDVPCPRPLPAVPAIVQPIGRHEGTWIGAHGNHVFYRPRKAAGRLKPGWSPVLALKRQALEGCLVEVADPGD